jgi:hypothetical protein
VPAKRNTLWLDSSELTEVAPPPSPASAAEPEPEPPVKATRLKKRAGKAKISERKKRRAKLRKPR